MDNTQSIYWLKGWWICFPDIVLANQCIHVFEPLLAQISSVILKLQLPVQYLE